VNVRLCLQHDGRDAAHREGSTATAEACRNSYSPVHTSNNVETILSNATSRMILSTKSKQTERVEFVSTLFRLC